MFTVADPGEGPGRGQSPTLFLDQTGARRAKKKFFKIFWETGFPTYLRVWMTAPPPLPPFVAYLWDWTASGHLSAHRPSLSRSHCKVKVSSLWVILWYNKASSANNLSVHITSSGMSLMNNKNINGLSTVPCGTPEVPTTTDFEHTPSTMTLCDLLVSHDLILARVLPWMP